MASLICLVTIGFLVYYRHRFFTFFTVTADSILSVVWIVGLGFLADAMRWTLLRQCNTTLWGNDQGVLLCALYKLLFSASFVATSVSLRNSAFLRVC